MMLCSIVVGYKRFKGPCCQCYECEERETVMATTRCYIHWSTSGKSRPSW